MSNDESDFSRTVEKNADAISRLTETFTAAKKQNPVATGPLIFDHSGSIGQPTTPEEEKTIEALFRDALAEMTSSGKMSGEMLNQFANPSGAEETSLNRAAKSELQRQKTTATHLRQFKK